ncbi:unnamed protein product [Caenorhabditis angaria]|uniref:Serine/threonine-protein kinase 1 n=1 Tax=Caenorhabditis angaria TaxID=860376 RepID=A0A9P1IFW8_9PELO|nr:unnamed protein product [Caenorhabditis angaria]
MLQLRSKKRWFFDSIRMIKRKLQDLAVCCSYQVDFLHEKKHSVKEFKRKYEVLDEIGRGGFGIVYEATRKSDGKAVAVKFVQHKHVRSWTMTCRQLIPSEVCHLETCSDIPGVIRIIDWFANSKGFLIVMERPENCMDLFDMVSVHGPLSEPMAKYIFKQVIDTVYDMYAKHGLLHRDIKDENLIVNMTTGEVKLVDFGATAYAEKATKKEFQGTKSYCPPEWFRDQLYLPLEATSWSLGVLLFILLTGKLPFKNEIQICLGSVKFPKDLSKEVCQLIKSCLTTSTSTRASLAQIKAHNWLRCDVEFYTNPTFEETLGAFNVETLVDPKENEEDKDLNDIILTRQREIRVDDDMESICTMITAVEDRYEPSTTIIEEQKDQEEKIIEQPVTFEEAAVFTDDTTNLIRSDSRYDNISSSSFCDYISLASSSIDDFTSTSDIYQSACDVFPNSTRTIGAIKSASAYNLAKMRKKSSIFKSFDTELDPVNENDPMIQSTYSNDDVTISEDTNTTSNSTNLCENRVRDQVLRMSRHRPLQFASDSKPPTLAIFQVAPSTVN